MTTIDKIRQEVERLKKGYNGIISLSSTMTSDCLVAMGKVEVLNKILLFLTTLKEEPQGLNEAVKEYFQGLWPGIETAEQCNTNMHFTPPAIMRLAEHFYNLGKESRSSIDGLDEAAEEYAHKGENYTVWLENEIYFVDDIILIKKAFKAGAEWAINKNEKDLALTWEDIGTIAHLIYVVNQEFHTRYDQDETGEFDFSRQDVYEEVLKRFMEEKK